MCFDRNGINGPNETQFIRTKHNVPSMPPPPHCVIVAISEYINRQYNIDNLYLHSMLETCGTALEVFGRCVAHKPMAAHDDLFARNFHALAVETLFSLRPALFMPRRSICECLTGDTKHEQDE